MRGWTGWVGCVAGAPGAPRARDIAAPRPLLRSIWRGGDVQKILKEYDQRHLVAHWVKLSRAERKALVAQLRKLDFAGAVHAFESAQRAASGAAAAATGTLQPVDGALVCARASQDVSSIVQWEDRGNRMIREGKVGVLLMAGGQGTRLGSAAPKGCYDIGLPSRAPLFRLQADRLASTRRLAGKRAPPIPWYILTSDATHDNTVRHFEKNGYYGLPRNSVFFFKQGTLPVFQEDGHIQLASPSALSMAPDGNGGIYTAVGRSGALQDMRKRGVEALFVYGVDNALVKMADPTFMGYCAEAGAEVGAKVVEKASPTEKVGVYTQTGTSASPKLAVTEYSELTSADAMALSKDGGLRFRWSNLCMHYFTVDFVERMVGELERSGRYHQAKKHVQVSWGKVNAIKAEMFIFDTFPDAHKVVLFEVNRASEFAPVKNKEGNDSPATAVAAISELHANWVHRAGGTVTGDGPFEVSPRVSIDGENLRHLCNGKTFKRPGMMRR
eukprot:PRCOL_00005739-RA